MVCLRCLVKLKLHFFDLLLTSHQQSVDLVNMLWISCSLSIRCVRVALFVGCTARCTTNVFIYYLSNLDDWWIKMYINPQQIAASVAWTYTWRWQSAQLLLLRRWRLGLARDSWRAPSAPAAGLTPGTRRWLALSRYHLDHTQTEHTMGESRRPHTQRYHTLGESRRPHT